MERMIGTIIYSLLLLRTTYCEQAKIYPQKQNQFKIYSSILTQKIKLSA